jgi:hypothetical protein
MRDSDPWRVKLGQMESDSPASDRIASLLLIARDQDLLKHSKDDIIHNGFLPH